MVTLLTGVAVGFDFLGTLLVLIDTVRSRGDLSRLEGVQTYIERLEISAPMEKDPITVNLPIKGAGMSFGEAADMINEASKQAIVASKKVKLDLKGEIDKANRFPLIYVAIGSLLLGIVLHGIEAFVPGNTETRPAAESVGASLPSSASASPMYRDAAANMDW
jgi:hypothetical protein